jgi:hypothetical protein
MSGAGSFRLSSNGSSSPRQTLRDKQTERRTSETASSETGASDRGAQVNDVTEGPPLWVSLPAVQELFSAAVPGSASPQSVSMIAWLKFCSDHSRCFPALAALNKTDFITIFLDTKRGSVGADSHELSLADFCSCLIALADRSNLISIPSSPVRSAVSLAPSAQLLSAMSSFTSSLLSPKDASPPIVEALALSSAAPVISTGNSDISDGTVAPSAAPMQNNGASSDISSQVLQLLHIFYEFYSNGATRLSHDSYVQCLIELQALQAVNAASGDATHIFFKFAATPDRGITKEQFVDSFVHLAHVSAPESPLHSSLHSLVVLGMGSHFSRFQERQQLREVLESATVKDVLKETQAFCEDAFRACSGGKSIINIAQVNRWLAALKLQTPPSQTDIIRVFRDILRLQAARGSSSVGLDVPGFQSFLLHLSVLSLHTSQLTPSNTSSSFVTLLKHMGWVDIHGPIAAQRSTSAIASTSSVPLANTTVPRGVQGNSASPVSASQPLPEYISPQRGYITTQTENQMSSNSAPPITNAKSPPIPAGISISLTKTGSHNVAASVGADVLTQLADLDQASAFAELQRIYTDKQVLVVQRKKELQAELDAWTTAEYEAADLKYKEQAIFRPTPALQDRERALQVLLSNANKTHPDELRRQQQIVEAFASKERQAWRFRCDVYASTVRSRVKMAVDAKKSRLADTLRSMQIQLEVNMKKDFEALSRRFSGKSTFLRSSAPAPHANDKLNSQPQSQTNQSAATTPRMLSVLSSNPSATSRSQSAPRKHVSSTLSNHESDGQEQQHKPNNSALRERPQSSIPTMSRRKSVLQEMEEAYLKAASRFCFLFHFSYLYTRTSLLRPQHL